MKLSEQCGQVLGIVGERHTIGAIGDMHGWRERVDIGHHDAARHSERGERLPTRRCDENVHANYPFLLSRSLRSNGAPAVTSRCSVTPTRAPTRDGGTRVAGRSAMTSSHDTRSPARIARRAYKPRRLAVTLTASTD